MISSMDTADFWAKDLLKWSALNPFWNGATNNFWFGLSSLIVASLNLARNSRRDFALPWRMVNRLVTITLTCLLP
ncbi:hypothetical protein A2U01_0081153 [Trifolium medium]|uniref:Uncharacterized protein n=1 Tax=Trifolium medium TaxID=97028 RepID=A0A392TFW5_9FABA|nr:hypothetical protein [Trifolium medium]